MPRVIYSSGALLTAPWGRADIPPDPGWVNAAAAPVLQPGHDHVWARHQSCPAQPMCVFQETPSKAG